MTQDHAVRRLPGGINPPAHKSRALSGPIRNAPLPPRLVVPVSQSGHGEPQVTVNTGERVLKGQLIAVPRHQPGVAAHAPSSGTVSAVGPHPVPNVSGLPELCVSIDPDGEERWIERRPCPDYRDLAPEQLLRRIADAGISGLGGAGFPAHVKLARAENGIDTLIINACECEPFISADDALMREHSGDIIAGIRILLHLLRPQRCLIGIEDDKPEAAAALRDAIDDERIEVHEVESRYPSGSERQLIWLLTGIELPGGELPLAHGMLSQNVGTARAVARAILHDEPLISRVTTLTGAALARPGNLEALVGTPLDWLLKDCCVDGENLSRLIMGGSLMGLELPALDLPLLKTTNCLIATTEDELPTPPPARACIRCGLCAEVCPVSLLPQQLYWYARSQEHDKAREHNLFDCIECGACAWACPSHIPLVQYYRAAKAGIREEEDKHHRAEYARQRFEAHQQRMAREQAREEERRRERARLAKERSTAGKAGAKDAIQAALERVKKKKQEQQDQGNSD